MPSDYVKEALCRVATPSRWSKLLTFQNIGPVRSDSPLHRSANVRLPRWDAEFKAGASACHLSVEDSRILRDLGPIGPARTFRRVGDDGVDHGGVEVAMNHQRLSDCQHRP
jgi:hypothetical protein